MKNPLLHHPKRGFTLIELLVVIAIIMVLAAAGFAVGTGVLNRAKKLKAENTATAIDQAVNMFYSEYGGFPTRSTDNLITITTDSAGTELLNALLGNDTGLNPRGISFLSVTEGKPRGDGGIDGLITDSDDEGNVTARLYDPWGNHYTVVMDGAFEGYLEFTPTEITGLSQVRLSGRRVAVYSPGVPVGDEATQRTMVKTW